MRRTLGSHIALEERLREAEGHQHDLAQQVGEWRQRAEAAEDRLQDLESDERRRAVVEFLEGVAGTTSKFAKTARALLQN